MLIAAALAAVQPLPSWPPPPPGSYGWLGDLAGSCFSSQGGRPGSGRRDCFRMEGGYLFVTTRFSTPGGGSERHCRFEPLGSALLLRCEGEPPSEQVVHLEADRAIFQSRDSRSRVLTPSELMARHRWRRVGRDRIEHWPGAVPAGLTSPRIGPVVLIREVPRR